MRGSGQYSGRVVGGSELNSTPFRHGSTGSTPTRLPVRTCVGCKERVPAVDLLRVVVGRTGDSDSSESVIVPDVHRRLPGRGAWLHPVSECLVNAERRRAFGRALRVQGVVDVTAVEAFIGNGAEAHTEEPVAPNTEQ
jgi:predicted RNA-binding protein YlxR (DUF448 family)